MAASRRGLHRGEWRARSQLPEPRSLWIRFVPAAWPHGNRYWIDLAAGCLGIGRSSGRGIPAAPSQPPDDLVYLPPVPPQWERARRRLAEELLACATPVLWHRLADDPDGPQGATVVTDLLDGLLSRTDLRWDRLAASTAAVFPLIPGLTDDPETWDDVCRGLAGEGVRCVQALTPKLTPSDRRRLSEGRGERAFRSLFHGPEPSERAFAQVAFRLGLRPFMQRPLPPHPLARRRELSAALALIGELWLRLDRGVGQGQVFYRASRWADRAPYDLLALARDGNLGLLSWLEESSRRVVDEWAEAGTSSLLNELLAEYLDGDVNTVRRLFSPGGE